MLLMGKSTISTGPFSIAMLVYQRVSSMEFLSLSLSPFSLYPLLKEFKEKGFSSSI
jgi:hypothetical protein